MGRASHVFVGSILATVILLLFLKSITSMLVVGLSIPVSLVTTFIVMKGLGRSLNIVSLAGLAFGAFLLLHGVYGQPLAHYDATEYAALARLNIMSASALTAFVALLFSNMLSEAERSAEAARGEKSG